MSRSATPPRDDLIRCIAPAEIRAAGAGDAGSDGLGTLFGHFAVFDEWTVIDSWEGRFRERLARGAFRKTMREQRSAIQTLFDHGFDPTIGDKPLGVDDVLREDEYGAYSEVPLVDTSYNRDIAALLRAGALRGQSFRFSVVKDEWVYPKDGADPGTLPERTIRELRLYEKGPVTFPAYAAATAGIRSAAEFRSWRRAGGAAPCLNAGQLAAELSTGTPPADGEPPSTTHTEPTRGHSGLSVPGADARRHRIEQLRRRAGSIA